MKFRSIRLYSSTDARPATKTVVRRPTVSSWTPMKPSTNAVGAKPGLTKQSGLKNVALNPNANSQKHNNAQVETTIDLTDVSLLNISETIASTEKVTMNMNSKQSKLQRERERRLKGIERKEKERLIREATEAKRNAAARKPKKGQSIELYDGISIANLSTLLNVKYDQLARSMKSLGFDETHSDFMLDAETASMICLEYGMNPIVADTAVVELKQRPEPDDWSVFPLRPPVVTIMGHVDHGKTTLLDSLRKASVAQGEAGGITQHIGAFSVLVPSGHKITFLDTPGHAAFSSMRQRGAQVTDIVILVVAADDGVMPQTIEAFQHATAANVPIIVAINKCDKQGANPTKTKDSLLQNNIVLEEFGGDIPAVEVSGLTVKGLDMLEETVLAVSEVLDLRGDSEGLSEATTIESDVSRERGFMATVIVSRGTLKPGDILVSGNTWCKAKCLLDEHGREVLEAPPSTPVQVMGWKDLPVAGDIVIQVPDESQAKRVVQSRLRLEEHKESLKALESVNSNRQKDKQTREEAQKAIQSRHSNKQKTKMPHQHHGLQMQFQQHQKRLDLEHEHDKQNELRVIVKADVHGSLEAVEGIIQGLPTRDITVKVIDSGVGPITDSDVALADASEARIVAFNVAEPSRRTLNDAAQRKVTIMRHEIIYDLIDGLKTAMSSLMPPEIIKEVLGEANVLQVFEISVGKAKEVVAGCRLQNGKISRGNTVRVMREGKEVYQGSIKTFKHHKKDILEASKGLECGIAFDKFDGVVAGDVVQAIKIVEKPRSIF